ncbi:MAG: hypothetical protein U9Q15_02975, partial [Patescibacteria group bacterium]|nr:hypothetical protein [Patescibacteria group bacterium]
MSETGAILDTTGYSFMDEIYFTLKVSDGEDFSPLYTSSKLILSSINRSPVAIQPELIYQEGSLSVHYNYIDLDADTEQGTLIYWYQNGELILSGSDITTLSSEYYTQNDIVSAKVIVSDGQYFGQAIETESLFIPNTVPSIDGVSFKETDITVQDTIVAQVSGWNDQANLEQWYQFDWYVNNTLVADFHGSVLSSYYFSKNDTVFVSVTPKDNYTKGIPYTSQIIVIKDSPATITSVDIPATSSNLAILYADISQISDYDNEGSFISYEWESQKGVDLVETGAVIDLSNYNIEINDVITVSVSIGDISVSDSTIIVRSVPFVQNTTYLYEGSPIQVNESISTGHTLSFDYDFVAQYSGSTIQSGSSIIWYHNGDRLVAATDDELVITDIFKEGDLIRGSFVACDTNGMCSNRQYLPFLEIGSSNSRPYVTEYELIQSGSLILIGSGSDIFTDISDLVIDDDAGDVTQSSIYWYKNSDRLYQYDNTFSLSGSIVEPYKEYSLRIDPFDGKERGGIQFSDSIRYIPTGATFSGVSVYQQTEDSTILTDSQLITQYPVYISLGDLDNPDDLTLNYSIDWYQDSGSGYQVIPSAHGLFQLPSSYLDKSMSGYKVEVTVSDTIYPEVVQEKEFVIQNTAPSFSSFELTPEVAYKDSILSYTSSDITDLDISDTLVLEIEWFHNDILSSTGTSFSSTGLSVGDHIEASLMYSDGTATSSTVVKDIYIQNKASYFSGTLIPQFSSTGVYTDTVLS